MKRIIQITAVSFALIMLAGYVVYSQKQQNRTVAPGSKVLSPPETSKTPSASNSAPTSTTSTASDTSFQDDFVASSSKSISPVVKVRPPPATLTTPTNPPRSSDWIAPMTSKSGHIFDSSVGQGTSSASGMTNRPAPGASKSPPAKTESDIRKVLAATNTPPTKASP